MIAIYEMSEVMEAMVDLVGVIAKLEKKLERSGLSERRRWGAERELFLVKRRLTENNGKGRR